MDGKCQAELWKYAAESLLFMLQFTACPSANCNLFITIHSQYYPKSYYHQKKSVLAETNFQQYLIFVNGYPQNYEEEQIMHYTGTIWRPPYEASSLLLEVTAGCTHHKCKFCTLYADLPFSFRMSPLEDIAADIKEASEMYRRLQGHQITRTFLTGANPFVLRYDRLTEIANLIRAGFPEMETIGSFARITDISTKSDAELAGLRKAGYDGLTIGIETADDEALRFMNKGYLAADILEQCGRLDRAGIRYSFFYLTGISGAGRGVAGAKATAAVCNQLHPTLIGANMMTIYPDSELYQEIRRGTWAEESETEKYKEVRTLVENLNIPTVFAALGASNAFQMQAELPRDRQKLLDFLDHVIEDVGEDELRRYRESVHHL